MNSRKSNKIDESLAKLIKKEKKCTGKKIMFEFF